MSSQSEISEVMNRPETSYRSFERGPVVSEASGAPQKVDLDGHPLLRVFDAVYIIHLRERTDRYQALRAELADMGIDIEGPKIRIMEGQWPTSANGFTSIGAYANFMSHLRILREAKAQSLNKILILEDDAIFRRSLRSSANQVALASRLTQNDWGLAFIGHKIDADTLRNLDEPSGFMSAAPNDLEFLWAHCYAVSANGLSILLPYFESTLTRPAHDPLGAQMYVDGAYNLFRRLHPGVQTLVSKPRLSSQRGSPSSIAARKFYEKNELLSGLLRWLRSARDELWRRSILTD
jgi:glycosyl transferase, family 25